MVSFRESAWSNVDELRARVAGRMSSTVRDAAQAFVEDIAGAFETVVLARFFLVVPFGVLPEPEAATLVRAAGGDARLGARTRVLSLLGTHGVEASWCDRAGSRGHLAIPLLQRGDVEAIPMVAKLLADLNVDFAALDDGRAVASREMLGGRNRAFFISDARAEKDRSGRFVIPSRDFVSKYDIRTVFGMGGAYVDGTLAVTIVFTREDIDRLIVDRFPSLIANFKMSTSGQMARGQIYQE